MSIFIVSLKSGIRNVFLRTQSCPIRLTFQEVRYTYLHVMFVSFHCKGLAIRQNLKLDPEPRWSASKKLRTRQQQCTEPEIDTWRNSRHWGKDLHVKYRSLLSQIVPWKNGRYSTTSTWWNGLHSAKDWHVENWLSKRLALREVFFTEPEIVTWRNGPHFARGWHVEKWSTLLQRLLKVLSSHLRGGSWVVSFDRPYIHLHFRNFFNLFKRAPAL